MNAETIKYLAHNPRRLFGMLGSKGLLNWMPDELYIKIQFKLAMGYWPDLKAPKTFNEKLQWLKLHDRNPLYTTLVDKYAVREYIAKTLGEEYLIPLVGGPWKNADEIDFDALPEQFVLKCNHDSGGVIVCKDKSKLDIEKVRAMLNKRLRTNYYFANREWPYKGVKPCIFAEQFLEESSTEEIRDYKFWAFSGKAKFLYVCTERNTTQGLRTTFFDLDWNPMPITRHYLASEKILDRPKCLQAMIELTERLSKDLPFARIDLYEVGSEAKFGEVTLYPGVGMKKFDPPEWDAKIGSWLELPAKE